MKKKFMALLFAAAAVFALTACGSDPVATVNGVDISKETYQEYIDYTMNSYGLGAEFSMDAGMAEYMQTQTIDSLIQMEELKQACEEKGCAPTDDELDEYIYSSLGVTTDAEYNEAVAGVKSQYGLGEDTMRMIIGSGLYSQNLADALAEEKGLKVDDAAVDEAYEESPDDYDNRTVSHILIMPEVAEGREAETDENGSTVYTDEEWDAAKAKAEELIKELDNGADFAELAKENSADTGSAANGGALDGSFTKNGSSYVEEFTDASFKLVKVGQYTVKPVKSSYGYHIILCTGIQDADNDFDGLKETIREKLLNEAKQTVLSDYLAEFAEKSDVVIYYGSNATDEDAAAEEDAAADETETTEETEE